MYKEHPVFEKPTNENAIIWRYFDFTKFVSLVDKRALFFARADKLSDLFEGSYSKANIKLRPILYEGKIPDKALQTLSRFSQELRRFTLINSWHLSDYESAAMWKLYSTEGHGIAVQSTFKKLSESLKTYLAYDVFIGKVHYIDYENAWLPEGNSFYPFLHKRRSFEYEQELRAVIQEIPTTGETIDLTKELFDFGIYVPVDLDVLVERVFISPTAPNWFGELVSSVVSKYNFKKNVSHSGLNERPVW